MLEADGEAPSKIHCRGEARNPDFEVLLEQTHVNRCVFALEHRIIYSQIATALSLPCVPSVKPMSPLFFLAKQATTEDESPPAVDGIHAQRGNREAEWCDENNRIVCEIIYLFYFT